MFTDKKVVLLVTDDDLRADLYLLLVKAGAAVYPAKSDAQLNLFLKQLDIDLLILAGKNTHPGWQPALN